MTYESWRTVEAPLTDSRIRAIEAGHPVHLIIWPTSQPGTNYVLNADGTAYFTVTGSNPYGDGRRHWHFKDHNLDTWEALTIDDGQAHATVLTRKHHS